MTATTTEPITNDWTTEESIGSQDGPSHATAAQVNQRLGGLLVVEIEDQLVPFMAAAAAEMALGAGIPWQFSADDPPVALLRLIAKAGIKDPQAGGPHTDRLLARLELPTSGRAVVR